MSSHLNGPTMMSHVPILGSGKLIGRWQMCQRNMHPFLNVPSHWASGGGDNLSSVLGWMSVGCCKFTQITQQLDQCVDQYHPNYIFLYIRLGQLIFQERSCCLGFSTWRAGIMDDVSYADVLEEDANAHDLQIESSAWSLTVNTRWWSFFL